ncbi:MAG: putative toxin-antitoxin system toxin component, PIN family [Cyclobacteriaceae bacterium]
MVSALLSSGAPSKIISELLFERKIELQLSKEIFFEYVAVLSRPKFSKIPNFLINAEIVLSRIEELAIHTQPKEKLNIISDEPDNRFLELAMASQADYLITGNWNDFKLDEIGKTIILSPGDYWNFHRPKE